MTYKIVTRNNFLKLAIGSLIRQQQVTRKIAVIDTQCFSSLSQLLRFLSDADICNSCEICFLSERNLISQLVLPLRPIDRDTPEMLMAYKLRYSSFYKLSAVKAFLQSQIQLLNLSPRQQVCVNSLKEHGEVESASRFSGVSVKTFYSMIRSAAQKLHLTSLYEVKQFLDQEKHFAARIDAQEQDTLRFTR